MEESLQTETDPNIQWNQDSDVVDATADDLKFLEDLLKQVYMRLSIDDLEDMKFLVKPHLKDIQWRGTEDVYQFLKILGASIEKREFPFYVSELIFTIERYDLLEQIGITKLIGKYLFEKKSLLDPLMKLLFKILKSLDTNDANDIAKELSQLLNSSKQSMDLCCLFAELTLNDNISSSFLEKLYLKLRDKNHPFAVELERFVKDEDLIFDSPPDTSLTNSESSKITHQVKSHLLANKSSVVADDFYDMSTSPCGICVIFNMEKFKENRLGTNIDRDNLKRVFESFDFEVELHNDLSSVEMRLLLNELADRDHQNYSCFVCCILSHGEDQSVFGADGKSVDIYRDIIYKFSDVRCNSLANKPKLFFIQACQGDKMMKPAILEQEEYKFRRSNVPENEYPPSLAHFLLSLATVPSFQSVRRKSGSLFISHLTEELSLNGDRRDIYKILKVVNRKVAKEDISKNTNEIRKQMPYVSETLTKQLIFKKKG